MVGDETDFNSAKEKIQQNLLMVFSFLVWNYFIMSKCILVVYVKLLLWLNHS
jgi:hypothetical protein